MRSEVEQALIDAALQEGGPFLRSDCQVSAPETPWPRWPAFANIVLGTWLLSNPFTLGYTSQALRCSDIISGCLIIFFACLSFASRRAWMNWANAGIGVWLLFSPLVFWAPNAAAFDANTLIGTLVIMFSVILPATPGEDQATGPEIPPDWSYNPSGRAQRLPIIALALVSFFIARYLATYQLGFIGSVWDPLFGDGTKRVLESDVARAFPISDAGLGAISYLVEALTGLIGGARRWRTMPWVVVVFGFLVVPVGVVSIVLVILQPLAVGAWCTLCLGTALMMLLMISPAADEVIATIQFLRRSHRAARPFWRTFWKGETVAVTLENFGKDAAPEMAMSGKSDRGEEAFNIFSALGLTQVTWTLIVSAALGVWLMVAPFILQSMGPAAHSDQVAGTLVITFSIIALGEVGRSARWLNVLFGAWLLIGPWVLSSAVTASNWNSALTGAALILLSIPRGEIRERYGDFNRYII